MEKFEKLMLPITFVLLLALGWVFLSSSRPKAAPLEDRTETAEDLPNTNMAADSKRGEMGEVSVEVTPLSSTEYEVAFNTHSVDLDFDFMEIIKLKDDLGNVYDAETWSGERGGHHLQGTIVFPKIKDQVNSVIIIISGVEGAVLSFEWLL